MSTPLESAFAPEILQAEPWDVLAVPEMVTDQGARLRLYPKPAAMDRVLNAAANGRWKLSRYRIGNTTYCKLSLWDSDLQMFIERDGPDMGTYKEVDGNPARAEEAGSLYGAMLHFGFWRDLAAMPSMVFGSDQVHLAPISNASGKVIGYRVAGKLSVAAIERGENGTVTRVVLKDSNGGQLQWQR